MHLTVSNTGNGDNSSTLDFTLTPAANTFQWTGLSGTGINWSNGANWDVNNGLCPAGLDTVILTAAAAGANTTITVDAPAAVYAMTVTDSAWTISGNSIAVGAGGLTYNSTATSTISSNLSGTGTISVNSGQLNLDGSVSNAIAVNAGATLSGTGALAGGVTLAGGTLTGPLHLTGNVNSVGGTITPGGSTVMTITGSLTTDPASTLNFALAAPTATNDNITVNGTAGLDGTLNVSALSGFAVGTYTLINCSGQLTDNGLKLGPLPTIPLPSSDPYASRHNYNYTYGLSSVGGQEQLTVKLNGDVLGTGVLGASDIDTIYHNLTVLPAGFTSWSQWPWAAYNSTTGQYGPPAYNAACNVDGDPVQEVTQDDVTYELRHYFNTSYADANLDTYTDFGDFQTLLYDWQQHGGWANGDFNGDGVVDFADFQILLDYWNPSGWNTTSEVPEPASLSLLLLWRLGALEAAQCRKESQ